MNRTPTPASQVNQELPPKLDEIIGKALEKDRRLRYQNAADISTDLQRLKRDSGFGRSVATAGEAELTRPQKSTRWKAVRRNFCDCRISRRGSLAVFLAQVHPLTYKDTIVLADFVNTTGDPVFDRTLRQGLSFQLEQSPFLSIVTDQQIQQTLQMMGHRPDAKLTPEIARELCQRTVSAAVLDGSIAQIGSQYLLALRVVKCASGNRWPARKLRRATRPCPSSARKDCFRNSE